MRVSSTTVNIPKTNAVTAMICVPIVESDATTGVSTKMTNIGGGSPQRPNTNATHKAPCSQAFCRWRSMRRNIEPASTPEWLGVPNGDAMGRGFSESTVGTLLAATGMWVRSRSARTASSVAIESMRRPIPRFTTRVVTLLPGTAMFSTKERNDGATCRTANGTKRPARLMIMLPSQ
ncbi:Uncharacterised protein [Mycobacteroides abscessus]|nr:Uncharacterised protein [Mycobacteroides abscessus]